MVQEAGCQKSLVIELSLQGHAAVLERMSKQLSTSSPEESAAKRMQEWRGERCGFSLATFSLGTQSLWLKTADVLQPGPSRCSLSGSSTSRQKSRTR